MNDQPKVTIIGSGPIRIGQGIGFDPACVYCIRAVFYLDCAVSKNGSK